MATRRDFHRFAVATAVGAAVPATGWRSLPQGGVAEPATGPTVTETSSSVTIDNGVIRLVVTKSSGGRATSLTLNGKELLGGGGVGYYDIVSSAVGTPVSLPASTTTYQVRRGDGFVDVSCTITPTSDGPFTTVRHFVVRAGEPGIHLASEFRHSASVHGFKSDQHRFVLRVNPSIFTNASVEDDPFGVTWRAAAATLPTPGQLTSAPAVMDATDDLNGLGSKYPRRYYTKYDWAVYLKDHVLHGLYGNGHGIWMTLANKESFGGGPTRQDLTLHQTDTTPLLLLEPQATHYGAPSLQITGEWSKLYGPFFVYCNTGTDATAMRADAMTYTDPAHHRGFYDLLNLPGWVVTGKRATVSATVVPAAGTGITSMAGAVAVLGDNMQEFHRTVRQYQYWADVSQNGSVELSGIRPGTYRLTVYKPGVWGEYVRDDLVVAAGQSLQLPAITWTPPTSGDTIWQIGTPDGTSAEFRRGSEFRQWGLVSRFPTDFPNGVVYTVGTSTVNDWNYIQYQSVNGSATSPWRIRFNLAEAPVAGSTATLTIALAAWSLDTARTLPDQSGNIAIGINGAAPILWTFVADDARGSLYRSGAGGRPFRRAISVDGSRLKRGTNEITLQINAGLANTSNWAAYDAIRLELT